MTDADLDRFFERVTKRAEGFELAGWTKPQAEKKALDYELSQLSGKTDADVALLHRTIRGEDF